MTDSISTPIQPETWVRGTWEDYLTAIAHPDYRKAKGYYHNGYMRLEMSPLGNPHSRDHATVLSVLSLLVGWNNIDLDAHDNCTYRRTGVQEAQPDLSFYVGENAEIIPWETSIIDLDRYPPPDLVIEIAASSLAEDLGEKRLLYERLGVQEYWVVDVQRVQVMAFRVDNQGSYPIMRSRSVSGGESHVIPNLDIAFVQETLTQSRQMNHGRVIQWLLSRLQ